MQAVTRRRAYEIAQAINKRPGGVQNLSVLEAEKAALDVYTGKGADLDYLEVLTGADGGNLRPPPEGVPETDTPEVKAAYERVKQARLRRKVECRVNAALAERDRTIPAAADESISATKQSTPASSPFAVEVFIIQSESPQETEEHVRRRSPAAILQSSGSPKKSNQRSQSPLSETKSSSRGSPKKTKKESRKRSKHAGLGDEGAPQKGDGHGTSPPLGPMLASSARRHMKLQLPAPPADFELGSSASAKIKEGHFPEPKLAPQRSPGPQVASSQSSEGAQNQKVERTFGIQTQTTNNEKPQQERFGRRVRADSINRIKERTAARCKFNSSNVLIILPLPSLSTSGQTWTSLLTFPQLPRPRRLQMNSYPVHSQVCTITPYHRFITPRLDKAHTAAARY